MKITKYGAALLVVMFSLSPASAWSGKVGWTYNARYPISGSVVVAEGLVLAGDSAGNLHAVHAASGQLAWVYAGTNTILGQPAISDKTVVFAQADGTVTALSLPDGALLWKHAPPTESYAADTILDGAAVGYGRVFVIKGDGKMAALSLEDGKALWTYESGAGLRSAPWCADGMVYLGEQGGVFSAVNPKTGKRDWGGGAGGAINTPISDGENVYFSSGDGSVRAVRIKGVVPLWKAIVGEPVVTPPIPAGEKVFLGTAGGKVAALSKSDGSVLWTFDTHGGAVPGAPVSALGLVFVCGGQGMLFVLDDASGEAQFTFQAGSGLNGAPAFSGGVLFVGSADGGLYAIR
ncbi:MAG: PQQ-binding-like beta-propeller repeat protein [Synergistaceae bacterium]|jgi:outer membrane protein assembly factor BamB|nr:PQQ-binding-like beta-propeller repeat protein [Synergistaceae bacterium]